jgi:hypothetical protein
MQKRSNNPVEFVMWIIINKPDFLSGRTLIQVLERMYDNDVDTFMEEVWNDLSPLFRNAKLMRIKTELRVTLNWAHKKLASVLNEPETVP